MLSEMDNILTDADGQFQLK